MELNVIGWIVLPAVSVAVMVRLIYSGAAATGLRRCLLGLGGAWFALLAGVAATGFFGVQGGGGTPAIGAAVALPLVAGIVAYFRLPAFRGWVMGIPLPWLIAINAGRVLGAFFLLLLAAGRLPPTFAQAAGWGDVFVGLTALPLVWAVARRLAGRRMLLFSWNTVGLLDLLLAVALGVGSAPGSPVRFMFETPDTGLMSTLPWFLIPGFLVPLYMLVHLAIFARLAGSAIPKAHGPQPNFFGGMAR